jgi:hypothetical protein
MHGITHLKSVTSIRTSCTLLFKLYHSGLQHFFFLSIDTTFQRNMLPALHDRKEEHKEVNCD